MQYDAEIHHRRSIRLQHYDYSQNGYYYVTICTKNREFIFGDIDNGKITLNVYGQIVGYFKYRTTKIVNKIRYMPGVPIWQRNYYERIIRDKNELYFTRQHIKNNPLKWALK